MSIAERIHYVLKDGSPDEILAMCKQAESLPNQGLVDLVIANSWGELIVARLQEPAVFNLLAVLSNARPPPPLRSSFYEKFETAGLCEACVAAFSIRCTHAEQIAINLCIRNLARSPPLRARLASSLPSLVYGLKIHSAERSEQNPELVASRAAALCNICCDNAFKAEAVSMGAVRALLQSLKDGPTHKAAEDMVACLGVLIAGFTPGLEDLFACGEAPILLGCLYCSEHPPLQVLAAEVLSDAASSSKMFTSWLVIETDLVEGHLGDLLDEGVDEQLVDAMLGLCKRLVSIDAFASKMQKGKGFQALQKIAQQESTETLSGFGPIGDYRKGVSRKDAAMSILASALHL